MWMMPLHLHVNQKSDYDDDYELAGLLIEVLFLPQYKLSNFQLRPLTMSP